MTPPLAKLLAMLAVGAALTACLRPTEERAERDLRVGKASTDVARVTVVDGLAVVRTLDHGVLRLWASAPAFEVELEVDSTGPARWAFEVDNAMTDLELESDSVEAISLRAELPTQKKWELRVAPGATARLRLASPDAQSYGPFEFALLSDVQEAVDDVQDIFTLVNREEVRFLLGAGDLTRTGSAPQLERFQRELRSLDVPYYTTLGNHELGQSPPPWHDWFGRSSFRFVFAGVQFSMLDSGSATIDPLVYDWLDRWLAEGRDRVHVVAMHVPPIDPVGVRNGSFASRNEAAKLLGRLRNGRVDLTLYGHIHSHYDFDNGGIQAFISGGGGAIPERLDGIGRHFMVFEVSAASGVSRSRVVRVD